MKKPVAKSSVKPTADQPQENLFESIASLCGPIIVALFVLTFVFQNFVIPSRSMASTLLVGDHVIADRASLSPPTHWASFLPYRPLQHGEPVVFYKPVLESDGSEDTLVKRVIALPGDRIHLHDGVVYLNGVAQNEPYAAKPPYSTFNLYRDDFPAVPPTADPHVTATWALDLPNHIQGGDLVVPPGCYFVMGDNRANSLDSRYWGFVHRDNLVGRPLFVYWSFDEPEQNGPEPSLSERAASTLHAFIHFFDGTRWNRTLRRIN
jgi:signal peptidase I